MSIVSLAPIFAGNQPPPQISAAQPGRDEEARNDAAASSSTGSSSSSGGTSSTEAATSASSVKQAEAPPSQVVSAVSTEADVKKVATAEVSQIDKQVDLPELRIRDRAEASRAETMVNALVTAMTAPVEEDGVAGAQPATSVEETSLDVAATQQLTEARQNQTAQFERGLSVVRGLV
ncbi:MAG: hypothetical protein AAF367_14105 [Pseudomonadota bacterium]